MYIFLHRYEGDEPVKSENKNNHLSELLKRIEERKKAKAAAATSDNKNNENVEKCDEETKAKAPRKKGKKRKLSNKIDAGEVQEETENHETLNDSEQVKVNEADKPQQEFMILGSGTQRKRKVVKRVLPHWLAHPEIISADLTSGPSLDELGEQLDSKLIKILKSNGISKLFPVQSSIITWLLKCNRDRLMGWWPRDTCVSAPTGSGK